MIEGRSRPGRVPGRSVGAVGKSRAGATVESSGEAGDLESISNCFINVELTRFRGHLST